MPRALPQAPLALFHTSSPPDWADGFSVKEQVDDGRNPEYKVIGELIETATSPQELFQLSELHELNSNHASLIITQISRLASEKKLETENIVRDERFQQLIGIMDSQVSSLPAAGDFRGKIMRWEAAGAPGIEPVSPAACLGFRFGFSKWKMKLRGSGEVGMFIRRFVFLLICNFCVPKTCLRRAEGRDLSHRPSHAAVFGVKVTVPAHLHNPMSPSRQTRGSSDPGEGIPTGLGAVRHEAASPKCRKPP